jgi:hypothetical protein
VNSPITPHESGARSVPHLLLEELTTHFARGIMLADAKRPVAVSYRSGKPYQAGIGPFTEEKTIELVMAEIGEKFTPFLTNVSYGSNSRQRCDLCIGSIGAWQIAVEFKMLRIMGDNGKPNDAMLTHILSPYSAHRSALTDCRKLAESSFGCPKALMVWCYEYEKWPAEPVVECLEQLAGPLLNNRVSAPFDSLIHPIHRQGTVHGWFVAEVESTDL